MKRSFLFFLASILVVSFTFLGCKKDIDDNLNPNQNKSEIRHYFTSASYGDIIALTIDGDNLTYSFINETTGESGSGSFRLSSNPKLSGIYETTIGNNKFYTIELPEVAIISTLPLGNSQNRICFGVSSDIHQENNYNLADFVGKYLFLNFNDNEKDPENFLGGYEVFADGSYTWGFSNSGLTSVNFSGLGSGTFNFVEGDNSRLQFIENDGFVGIGNVYPGKLFVMDNGEGNGFCVGVEYPSAPITQSQIAGNYKMLSITTFREEQVGYFSLPTSGKDISFYEELNDGTIYHSSQEGVFINSFEKDANFNNLFKMTMTVEYDWEVKVYFIILPGEMMMYFSTEPDGSIGAYGLALKID